MVAAVNEQCFKKDDKENCYQFSFNSVRFHSFDSLTFDYL